MSPSRAIVLGAFVGFLVATLGACGDTSSHPCTPANCDGCCDSSGVCQSGTSIQLCGSNGGTCLSCTGTAATCQALSAGGVCTGGVDAGTCSAANCASGCCANGACVAGTTAAQCGTGGATCASCEQGKSCSAGACATCAGCVDATGACQPGTSNTACGLSGATCASCDTANGSSCSNNACTATSCSAANCADGCCSGNTCVHRGSFSNAACGTGVGGAACTACTLFSSCDLDAGICDYKTLNLDGGLNFGDGGIVLPVLCDAKTPCPAGQCCAMLGSSGVCTPSGTATPLGEVCGSATTCSVCFLKTCNESSYTCNP